MTSSSYYQYGSLDLGEKYPYPSHVCAPNFVTLKLSGRDKFVMWQTQMLCLLKSHDMFGFIDGTLVSPKTSSSVSVSGKEIKGGDHHTHTHRLWARSDALVKGWILGSLSDEILGYVLNALMENSHQETDADFSAKDVWDKLQTICGPSVNQQPELTTDGLVAEAMKKFDWDLYRLVLRGNKGIIDKSFGEHAMIEKISIKGDTGLHVAIWAAKNQEDTEYFLSKIPVGTNLMYLRNCDGSTLLHVAAHVGNTEAVNILVEKDRKLLFAEDNNDQTPLAIAIANMHRETFKHLLKHVETTEEEKATFILGTTSAKILVTLISTKDFDLAELFFGDNPISLHSDAVLMSIVQNFPGKPNIMEEYIAVQVYRKLCTITSIDAPIRNAISKAIEDCFPSRRVSQIPTQLCFAILWTIMFFPKLLEQMLALSTFVKRKNEYDYAMSLLGMVCDHLKESKPLNMHHNYYIGPVFEATKQNAHQIVEEIVIHFPNAILCVNNDGHNIIQYAVICRSEKVYNILYLMGKHKNIYKTIKDSFDNNLLHLAGRLAPANKLSNISGAALQIQRELQWFWEVQRFVCPLNINEKNIAGETPQMVFTREHEDLVIEGGKWMKATAESYTITAALIITIVFAAAITVPGGNNQDTGKPVFTNNNIAFRVFAISDAISFFMAVTSLLVFLSILTARFAEQDFFSKLPTKLLIGLATLFISTTAMIVAFGATLYLVFGQSNYKILITIAVITCLPIISFVALQFPLVKDLISSTYCRSIFREQRNPLFFY